MRARTRARCPAQTEPDPPLSMRARARWRWGFKPPFELNLLTSHTNRLAATAAGVLRDFAATLSTKVDDTAPMQKMI